MLSEVNGTVSCDTPCESGIFSLAEPEKCVEACPLTMVMYWSENHAFCGECQDYLYYDLNLGYVACLSYEQCRMDMHMEPRIVYEDGKSWRVCTAPLVRTSLKIDEEWLPDVSRAMVISSGDKKQYFVQIGSKVFFSEKSFSDAVRGDERKLISEDALTIVNDHGFAVVLTTTGDY